MEHVSIEQGQLYYNLLKNTDIINSFDKFKINDTLGNPITFDYGVGDVSPTTLRYMKVLNDLMDNWDLNGMNIIEIGCGYGGQYTILKQLIDVKSYSVVDLPEVIKLTEHFNLNVVYTLDDFIKDVKVFHPTVRVIDETPTTFSNNKVLIW